MQSKTYIKIEEEPIGEIFVDCRYDEDILYVRKTRYYIDWEHAWQSYMSARCLTTLYNNCIEKFIGLAATEKDIELVNAKLNAGVDIKQVSDYMQWGHWERIQEKHIIDLWHRTEGDDHTHKGREFLKNINFENYCKFTDEINYLEKLEPDYINGVKKTIDKFQDPLTINNIFGKDPYYIRHVKLVTYRQLRKNVSIWFNHHGYDLDRLHRENVTLSGSKTLVKMESTAQNLFLNQGDKWEISFMNGNKIYIDDLIGNKYILTLLENPHKDFSPLELESFLQNNPNHKSIYDILDLNDEDNAQSERNKLYGEHNMSFDKKTVEEAEAKIEQLKEKKNSAEINEDWPSVQKYEEDIDKIIKNIKQGKNIHGEPRALHSEQERSRKRITKAVKNTLKRLNKLDSKLYDHLNKSIKTGNLFSYKPSVTILWNIST